MKQISLFVIVICSCIMAGCFVSNSLMNDFKKINDSLEVSNNEIRSRLAEDGYTMSKSGNTLINRQADTLGRLNADLGTYIDSLKKVMLLSDPKGDNINLPHDLLVRTMKGFTLQQKVLDVYLYARALMPDSIKHTLRDSMITGEIKMLATPAEWGENKFNNIPTIVAVSVLSKTENTCLQLQEKAQYHLTNHK